MNNKKGDYLLGLDVGTNSVGWASTDKNFNILRLKGKSAWGVRLFDEASDCKTRRSFRSSRRRIERRKYRITLLQNIFSNEVKKIDDTFFLRLKDSNFQEEDKEYPIGDELPLFLNRKLEKGFYKKFPTTWHLRKAIIDVGDPNYNYALSDIRFVYLAIHHILKHRGNFLTENEVNPNSIDISIEDIQKLNDCFNDAHERFKKAMIREQDDVFDELPCNDSFELIDNNPEIIKNISDLLSNTKEGKKYKQKELKKYLNETKDKEFDKKYIDLITSAITGGDYALKKTYGEEVQGTLNFNKNWEENESSIREAVGDDFPLIESIKKIFDIIYIKVLLSGNHFLSESFVNVYEQHKKDLKNLKIIIKHIDEHEHLKGNNSYYFKIFKDLEENNKLSYAAFVGHDVRKKNSIDDFNKEIGKIFNKYKEIIQFDRDFDNISKKVENRTFLSTISMESTSSISHQLHENELRLILQNAGNVYPFLKNNYKEIVNLFEFRVPYFVGPLTVRSSYSNLVKNEGMENVKITPLNYKEVVNETETRKNFISKLINCCTYLPEEKVLPSNSLLYQDFVSLDMLNSINDGAGNRMMNDPKIKVRAFEILSDKQKIKIKVLLNELKKTFGNSFPYYVEGKDEREINLSSRYLFGKVFSIGKNNTSIIGDVPNNPNTSNLNDYLKVEDVIKTLEIYSLEIKEAINVLNKKYSFNREQISAIKSYKCAGWGRVSKKFLLDFAPTDENGEINKLYSIYMIMLNNALTLQEVLNKPEYDFKIKLNNHMRDLYGDKKPETLKQEMLDSLPAISRRMTNQTLRIIDEIAKIKGCLPESIYIEVTRKNDKTKKGTTTNSRKEELTNFFESLKEDQKFLSIDEIKGLKEELKEKDDLSLRGKHLYLYFKQCGFDMYSGEKININEVLYSNKYDIDHIYPQNMIKDDSLDNMVLVNRTANQKIKQGDYPIPESIRCNENVQKVWKFLKEKKQISPEKYKRLTRTSELTNEELWSFVNRQITVLDQSNIGIINILKTVYGYSDNNIVFSKASAPSFIRKEFDIPKIRELNDCHHAVDAYLNVVSGKLLHDAFVVKAFSKDSFKTYNKYNYEKLLKEIINNNSDLKEKLDKLPERHDFLITFRNSYNDGQFYDIKPLKAGGKNNLVPIHTKLEVKNPSLYGGYNNLSNQYYMIGTIYDKNGKGVRQLIPVPILYVKLYGGNRTELEKALFIKNCKNDEKLVLENKIINLSQKIKINNFEVLLNSANTSKIKIVACSPLFLSKDYQIYLSRALKSLVKYKTLMETQDSIDYKIDKSEAFIAYVISKEKNKLLFNELMKIIYLPKYDDYSNITTMRSKINELFVFDDMSLLNQIILIRNIISNFTRDPLIGKCITEDIRGYIGELPSDKDGKIKIDLNPSMYAYSRPSNRIILKSKPKIIFESVTGLFRKEEDL